MTRFVSTKMGNFMDRLKQLKELGLTEYESKVYLALVRHGVLGAKEISTYSDVPSNRVYETAINLQRYGFVDIILGKPKRFRAIKPKAAIAEWIERRRNEVNLMERESKSLTKSLLKISFKETAPRTDVLVVRGEEETINKRNELFWLAKKERKIIVTAERGTERRVESRTKKIIKKSLRGGITKIIYSSKNINKKMVNFTKKLGAKIKFYPLLSHFKLCVIDGKMAFIESNEGKKEEWYLVWTNSQPIVWLLENYFDSLWKISKS